MAAVRALLSGLAAALALAGAAWAEPSLRPQPVAAGGQITLGDLFADAGPAAPTPLARAPGPGQRVVFSAAALQARAAAAGLRWRNAEGVREVVVQGGAASVRSAAAAGPSAQAAPDAAPRTLAVLSRDVARGEIISAQDVVWMDAPDNAPRDALSDAEALVGQAARRALMASRPLRAADVGPPLAIRRGETVTLLFESGGIRLSVRGRALADAIAGAPVKIVNIQSNRTLDAIAESPGVARVVPAATAMRLASAP